MENFAIHMLEELRITLPAGQALVNIAGATDRYALFKAGPVLAASVSIWRIWDICHDLQGQKN